MLALLNPPTVIQADDGMSYQFPTVRQAQEFEGSMKQTGRETLRLVPEVLPAARSLYDI